MAAVARINKAGLPYGAVVIPLLVVRPSIDGVLGLVQLPLGGSTVSLGFVFNLLVVGFAGLFVADALLVRRERQRNVAIIAVIWGPFLAAASLAALHAPSMFTGLQILFNYLTYAAVSLIALTYAPALSRPTLTAIVAATGILPLLVGLVLLGTGTAGDRLAATFSHPNILAFFLLVYVAFLFHAVLSGYLASVGAKAWIWGLIALAMLELLFTGTRSALFAMALFLVVYAAFRRPLLLVPMVAVAPLALLIPSVAERLADVRTGSTPVTYDYLVSAMRGDVADSGTINLDSGTWRKYLWQASWPMIEQRPLAGYGLGSFQELSSSFFPLSSTNGSGAHNIYVQVLFEGGVLLLAGLVWALAAIGAAQISAHRTNSRDTLCGGLILLSFSVAAASDNMLYYLSFDLFLFFVLFSLLGRRRDVGVPALRAGSRRPIGSVRPA